jgi:hypothetical protein
MQSMAESAISACGDGRSSLQEVMTMNEYIKRVIRISRELDMAALNAILMARRADGGAAGFRVAAAELRVFGARLGQDMAQLGALIYELVGRSAALLKQERRLALIERTGVLDGGRSLPADLLDRKRGEIQSVRAAVEGNKYGLVRRLDHAHRLCDLGRSLSRNAAVEATYAGAMTPLLTQVSSRAGAAVDEVVSILGPMRACLAVRS